MSVSNSKTAANAEAAQTDAPAPVSALAPFRSSAFTVLWLATVLSSIGTWMHDVGAGWLMTSLSPSPLMVALVQTATTLPIFLFALAAGAIADIVDRRRMLMAVQAVLAVLAGVFGIIVLLDLATPSVLLMFTFAMGAGAALAAPAWQAIVPGLVPRHALQPAVAINSVGINIARAIGPALAGFIITMAGVAMPFLINAVSYLVVVAALIWWRPHAPPQRRLPPEHLFVAVRTGLRYARNSAPLRATLGRAAGFFVFASAYWALLPLIARDLLSGGAELYGILLGCVGAGAVSAAFALPRLRDRLGPDRLVAMGTLGTACVLVVFAVIPDPVAAAGAGLLAGASWIAVLTSLNVSAQLSLPDICGQIASMIGMPLALLIAAAGATAAVPLTWRWKLQQGVGLDLVPSMHWPEPVVAGDVAHDRGPVTVTVEYRIGAADRPAFLMAIGELSAARRRDGAFHWTILEDAADSERFLENFRVASWLEHLRQHERVTHADRLLQEAVGHFNIGGSPKVTHWTEGVSP
jgi:predicted MFS family arabinose efflux permease